MDVDEQVPLRTLLVEDNRSEAALVGRLLQMADAPRFDVSAVHRLDDAQAILAVRRMDLVILDLGLPDVARELDGVKEIHRAHPDVPIVVLTGEEGSSELRESAVGAGAVDCLFKQALSPERLHQVLRDAVHAARADWIARLGA